MVIDTDSHGPGDLVPAAEMVRVGRAAGATHAGAMRMIANSRRLAAEALRRL
jgi:hypothetical protein